MSDFLVTFLGTGGSVAYNNGERVKFGTNSSCVVVQAGGETLVFDTGTGACGIPPAPHMHVFYSHYHIDHLCGLIFIPSLFNPRSRVDFYGMNDVKCTLENFLQPSFHPIGLDVFGAELGFNTAAPGNEISLGNNISVKTCALSHPGGAVGYRVEYQNKSFVYCLDSELANHQDEDTLREFTREADLLVLDAFFDDGKVIPGWGHSSWKECANWAKNVNAKQLALCHHNMRINDDEIARYEAGAKAIFPAAFAAGDYMAVEI
jgi:phosphoribosyl 1,2-cyclic phosphodiesterase